MWLGGTEKETLSGVFLLQTQLRNSSKKMQQNRSMELYLEPGQRLRLRGLVDDLDQSELLLGSL